MAVICMKAVQYIVEHKKWENIRTSDDSEWERGRMSRSLMSANAKVMEYADPSVEKEFTRYILSKKLQDVQKQIEFRLDGARTNAKRPSVCQLFESEHNLEKEIDQMSRSLNADSREVSLTARQQDGPNCWMYAAASLLRTKQSVVTPHKTLVLQLKEIEIELSIFIETFQKRYDADKVNGIKYWMESQWLEFTQTPVMRQMFPFYEWLGILSEGLCHVGTQKLVMEKFFSLHGFQYAEEFIFLNTQEKQSRLKALLSQKEHASIVLKGSSWKEVLQYLDPAIWSATGANQATHELVLDSHDQESRVYILKNSWGPDGGTPGKEDGKIHIPEDVLHSLVCWIYFIEKRPSISDTRWMWAGALLLENQQPHIPLVQKVGKIQLELQKLMYFMRELNSSSDMEREHKLQDNDLNVWGRMISLRPDLYTCYTGSNRNTNKLLVIERLINLYGLQFSKKLEFSNGKQGSTLRALLEECQPHNALILFEHSDWKTMVSECTRFHETNGHECDPGEPQFMVLEEFVEGKDGKGLYMFRDTYGLNPAKSTGNPMKMFSIPEELLHTMHFEAWFVEDMPLVTDSSAAVPPDIFAVSRVREP